MTDRRRFLSILAAAGLAPGALLTAGESPPAEITLEMVEAAEKLAGLEFSAEERQTLLEDLKRAAPGWQRPVELANGLQPSLGGVLDRPAPRPTPPPTKVPARPNPLQIAIEDRDLAFMPALRQAELIRQGSLTSTRLTKLYLARLKRFDARLHCVITLLEERALEQAKKADADLRAGRVRSPLHGVPWGVKDLFAVAGHRTTWGAKPFENQMVDETAEIVRRLDEAGCVLLAKLTTGALAMGDRWFGERTRNPWNPDQGSSGSSAGQFPATTRATATR